MGGRRGCCTTGRRTVFRRCPDRRDARRAQDERRAVRRRPTGNPAPKRFLAQRSDIDAGPAPRCNEPSIARPSEHRPPGHAKRVLASSKDAQMGLLDFHRARIAHSGVACNATLVDRAAVATEIAHRAVGRGQLGERGPTVGRWCAQQRIGGAHDAGQSQRSTRLPSGALCQDTTGTSATQSTLTRQSLACIIQFESRSA